MAPLGAAPIGGFSLAGSRNDRLGSTAIDNVAAATPPFQDLETMGTIMANGQEIKADVEGNIDKGFFLSENEWTCYRRNYFSTVCSFSLTPMPQPQSTIFFCPSKNPTEQYQVCGWAMCISAVVSENTHTIELVQHTPKRDKGPTHPPEKIPMTVKLPNTHSHHGLGSYPDLGRAGYADNYGNPAQSAGPVSEHSFERIQFKQATQNNGKRRAAQQYYHLVLELYADVGPQKKDRYVKVACRKSAPMIVRGRSPGHYSSERRGSQSSGANNQNFGSYQVMGEYPSNSMLVGPKAFTATYDAHTLVHNSIRQRELPSEHPMTSEEEKAIESAPGYMYYPGVGMDTPQTDRVDMMPSRHENDALTNRMASAEHHKVKPEYDFNSLPRQYDSTSLSTDRSRCGPFDGKPTSNGYYPTMLSQSGVNFSGMV